MMAFSHTCLKSSRKFWNLITRVTIKKHTHTYVRGDNHSFNSERVLGKSWTRAPAGLRRFVSSLGDESDIDPYGNVQEDLQKFYRDIRETLSQYTTNKEMHDIATYMYTDQEGHKAHWVTLPILIGKALNHHLCNVGNLTEAQSKIVMISDLVMATCSLHDDVVDNSTTRRGIPSANVVWYPYKSIVVGNMIYAICLSEAGKLDNHDITLSVAQMYEGFCRGQYMQFQKIPRGKDRLEHYLEKTNYKSGGAIAYGLRAMAQAVDASDALTDVIMKYAQNVCNVGQLLDDLIDFEEDLKEGMATAPVIFASREHPVLEEMMSRNFQQDGDVEKAAVLVKESCGMDEAKNLAGKYCIDALGYAKKLAVSPYQEMLEAVVQYYMYRLEYDTEDCITIY